MFSSLLKKKETQDTKMDESLQKLISKIDTMNLTEMRSYVKGNIKELEVTADGLNLVLERLIKVDANTNKTYINQDDMDSKKKKAFDLVLTILTNKKINIQTIELVQSFLNLYKEILSQYDKKNKDIYASRFSDAISSAVAMMELMTDMNNKMNVLSE